MNRKIDLIGLSNIPLIKSGDDIPELILESLKKDNRFLENGDIIVIAQSVISKSIGSVKKLSDIIPSDDAIELFDTMKSKSEEHGLPIKDPQLIQAILDESKEILETEHVMIVETKHGFVCANAGIDKSNVDGVDKVSILPENPDFQAELIRNSIKKLTGVDIAVIITDSFGRPFRIGSVGVAIGVAGISPISDKRGSKDLYGNILKSTIIGQVDNLASAAQLIMGESDEGLPVVIIKGYAYDLGKKSSISSILRKKHEDLFRRGDKRQHLENIIRMRRSYKAKFSSKKVERTILRDCIDMARWAPSAHNSQPWRYFLLEDDTVRERLINKMNLKLKEDLKNDGKTEQFIENKINKTRGNIMQAPHLVLLCLDEKDLERYPDEGRSQKEYFMGVQSLSASAMCFLLALESKGLAACWYCAPLFAPEIVKNTLKLPDSYEPMAFFAVGYPLEQYKAPKRKELSDVLTEL